VAGSTVGVDPRTPQKLNFAMGTVMSLSAQPLCVGHSLRPATSIHAARETSSMLAAATKCVNEFTPGTCQTSHYAGGHVESPVVAQAILPVRVLPSL
jgi:hypothetical protein